MLSHWLWRNKLWHCGDGHMEEPPSDLEDMEMVLGQQLARKWEPSSTGHESMNSVNNEREYPSVRIFPNESALRIRWPNYWSFFSIGPSNEYSGLISFRIDWFDLLAVQGPLEFSPASQFKSINSSALSLLYGPALTFVHDYLKNHSFDYTNLCWQRDISAL